MSNGSELKVDGDRWNVYCSNDLLIGPSILVGESWIVSYSGCANRES